MNGTQVRRIRKRRVQMLLKYLDKALVLIGEERAASPTGEIGIFEDADEESMTTLTNAADTLKKEIDNIVWLDE